MIRTAIIDDEKPARDRVKFFLKESNSIEIIGEADNGEKGLALLEQDHPQLIFLDIQMPVMDGFNMLKKCSYNPAIIFISAYDEYAIQAFEANAADYLLKPYTKQRFDNALNKVIKTIADTEMWESRISSILEAYKSKTNYLDQITVKKGHIYKIYDIKDIDFFRMDDGIIFLYSKGEKVVLDGSLNQLEKRMEPSIFFRVHRNAIVNLKRIKEVIPWGQGRLTLNFGESGKVHISRDKVKPLKRKIGLKF